MKNRPMLEVQDLCVQFRIGLDAFSSRILKAVDGVSFSIDRGESVGLVGESGCGKTTLGRSILGLIEPSSGRVLFDGADVSVMRGKSLKRYRNSAQMILQDSFDSLNPRLTVGSVIREALSLYSPAPAATQAQKVRQLMESVGLDPRYAGRYPHEFSGGQRQRIGIARALAVNPALIIADEPVSALDVSVQVQILNLLLDLQDSMNLSYLFIAHDLAVVRYVCDRILVMYLGRVVEESPADDLFTRPSHPYTRALLSAVPDVEKGLLERKTGSSRTILKGDAPSAMQETAGCPFRPRCPSAAAVCSTVPPRTEVTPGHFSSCHFAAAGN